MDANFIGLHLFTRLFITFLERLAKQTVIKNRLAQGVLEAMKAFIMHLLCPFSKS